MRVACYKPFPLFDICRKLLTNVCNTINQIHHPMKVYFYKKKISRASLVFKRKFENSSHKQDFRQTKVVTASSLTCHFLQDIDSEVFLPIFKVTFGE